MPGFLLSKLKQAQPSMRRRLFLYMGALALLLLAVLFVALLLLGQLKSPRAETEKGPDLPDGGLSLGYVLPVAECLCHGRSSFGGYDRPH